MLGAAVASVMAIGSLGFGCGQYDDAALAVTTMTRPTSTTGYQIEMQTRAVKSSLDDPRWEVADQREGLCHALIGNVRTALASGAITAQGRSGYSWLPKEDVRPGLAHEALVRGGDGTSTYAQLGRLLRDARWGMPDQRGPLCNALVHLQHVPLEVS